MRKYCFYFSLDTKVVATYDNINTEISGETWIYQFCLSVNFANTCIINIHIIL